MASRFTNLEYLETTDSTNTYAADAFLKGAGEGLVVVADRQLAGRGRHGRAWLGPPRSALLCSVLFTPAIALDELHLVSSALWLAARDAVLETSGLSVFLKWPNDLLADSRKLAGVLAELVQPVERARRVGLVVGIGINLTWPASKRETEEDAELAEIAALATSLKAETGIEVSRDQLLRAMLSSLEARYDLVLSARRAEIMEEYRSVCSTIGQRVRVTQASRTFEATAVSVRDDGRLVLSINGGEQAIDTADVVHVNELGFN